MQSNGNTVYCDAMMRMLERGKIERERAAAAPKQKAAADLKKRAEEYLAAGFSKREIVEHLKAQGFGDRDVSDAVGISLQDYQQGNY
jgi:hypothetical protein